jgi:outer membrane cobalamin receptor
MRIATSPAVLILATLLACASSGSSGTSGGAQPAGSRNDRMLVTRTQIDSIAARDAYELVQRTRAEFLREQRGGSMTISNPTPLLAVVYLDGIRMGGPTALRNIRAQDIEEVRYLSGPDATTRYGTDHGGGVIELKSRR